MHKYISFKNITLIWLVISSILLSIFELSGTQKNLYDGDNAASLAFVLDVSQSMNTRDMGDDSRLEYAKQKMYKLISERDGYELSLGIFAGESQRVLPFTSDYDIFTTMSQSLDSNNIVKQGSNIIFALRDALESFDEQRSGIIIILSDGGEDTIEISSEIRELKKQKNIEIIVVGVGTETGGYIPSGDRFNPYKIYNGERVVSKLNTKVLQDFAKGVGGKYIDISENIDLDKVALNYGMQKNYLLYLIIVIWGVFCYLLYREFYYVSKTPGYIK